jgi:Family of unknown function (DUF6299)
MSSIPVASVAALLTTLGATALAVAGPASAAPPDNDGYAGRVTVGSVPYSNTQDTSEATTEPTDAELNPEECGAPATDASVWYEVTAASDGALVADVSDSSYSAGVLVATGSPGAFSFVACGPGAVAWNTTAGETYSLLVIDDQLDEAGNGGSMSLTVEEAPPTPEIDITVNPKAKFTSTGSAILSGTVTCVGEAEFAFVEAQLTQQVGRLKINGFGGMDITCDGTTRPWSLDIAGDNGTFRGGKAASVTFAAACGVFDCGVDFEERIVQLSGKK